MFFFLSSIGGRFFLSVSQKIGYPHNFTAKLLYVEYQVIMYITVRVHNLSHNLPLPPREKLCKIVYPHNFNTNIAQLKSWVILYTMRSIHNLKSPKKLRVSQFLGVFLYTIFFHIGCVIFVDLHKYLGNCCVKKYTKNTVRLWKKLRVS